MTDSIDFDDPLGDATEVYDIEPTAETGFTLSEGMFNAAVEGLPATWRVDEIYGGHVYLSGFWRGDGNRCSGGAKLEPAAARRLGEALLRAAEYAERQEANADG